MCPSGFTSAAIHFFQLLVILLLRIACYTIIILLVKGFTSLRIHFSKMEWRTVLGLVMFGTMGDLISEASDSKDWRSYVREIIIFTLFILYLYYLYYYIYICIFTLFILFILYLHYFFRLRCFL